VSRQGEVRALALMSVPLPTDGATLIMLERRRQKREEGYGHEHDDAHVEGEMADAGATYAEIAAFQTRGMDETPEAIIARWKSEPGKMFPMWPWSEESFKPSADPIKNLVRAGALIAAEIDRLQRAETKAE
jgi:hypothetical protein